MGTGHELPHSFLFTSTTVQRSDHESVTGLEFRSTACYHSTDVRIAGRM